MCFEPMFWREPTHHAIWPWTFTHHRAVSGSPTLKYTARPLQACSDRAYSPLMPACGCCCSPPPGRAGVFCHLLKALIHSVKDAFTQDLGHLRVANKMASERPRFAAVLCPQQHGHALQGHARNIDRA